MLLLNLKQNHIVCWLPDGLISGLIAIADKQWTIICLLLVTLEFYSKLVMFQFTFRLLAVLKINKQILVPRDTHDIGVIFWKGQNLQVPIIMLWRLYADAIKLQTYNYIWLQNTSCNLVVFRYLLVYISLVWCNINQGV